MTNSGLSIHCHHDILIENCYDYDERVEAIKNDKPENEQEIRLRLFKLLSKEAIDELPEGLIKANAERDKAYAERDKANAKWTDKEAWHKKWCGCKEWNGEEIIFNK